MFNCKQVVKIVSSDENNSASSKMNVFFHLLMCKYCRAYVKQLDLIKIGFKKLRLEKEKTINPENIKNLEDQIIKKI